METVLLGVVGLLVLSVLAFWLIVLPLRLSKSLAHKWGYHAHCGTACEQGQQAERIKVLLSEAFKKGAREGMRGRTTFGPEDRAKILEGTTLLPDWSAAETDSDLQSSVRDRYLRIAAQTDAADNPNVWLAALAVAAGVCAKKDSDPASALRDAFGVACGYADITFNELADSEPMDVK